MANPELAASYPLVFNSGSRVTTDFRSQFHHIKGLVKERPEPTVMINTRDAASRDIRYGDEVLVKSPRGEVRMRAIVTDDIVCGAIDANMGGGGPLGPQAWKRCNINDLTDLRYDPISGFPIYKSLLCDVLRVEQSGNAVHVDTGEAGRVPRRRYVAALSQHRIYLDHNATTAPAPEVVSEMHHAMKILFGNASALHQDGRQVKVAIENARRKVAKLIGSTARRIVFTGCGSEANNQVIKGTALAPWNRKKQLITSLIEHPSVLMACAWLARFGFRVTYLPVDTGGMISSESLQEAMTEDTFLVSIMTASNETGTIQPIAELAAIAHGRGSLFHTDAVQAVGKIPVDVMSLGTDFLTLSAHKFHGPKGVGALYVRNSAMVEPLIHGGRQEHGLRAGTENSIGIIGLGKAAEFADRGLREMGSETARLRDRLQEGIMSMVPGAVINGDSADRLPNTLNISLPGIRGESMVFALDAEGISLSSGSACRSGSPKPSQALLAMGITEEQAHCALRFSLGRETTAAEIDRTLSAMDRIIRESLQTVRFVSCR